MPQPAPQSDVPELRIRTANTAAVNADGEYVLYWMIANRRSSWNLSLERAIDWASELKKPLVVLEALRADYRWASDRIHWFVIQGMVDNGAAFAGTRITYYPYLEPAPGAGQGLLAELARRASVVVTDDFPCFFLPRMVATASRQVPVRLELVDSNGILPMRAADKVFARAFDFRRFLQKHLRPHLADLPREHPLQGRRLPPQELLDRWPAAELGKLGTDSLAALPIDHQVAVSPIDGGSQAAGRQLKRFIREKLASYGDRKVDAAEDSHSGLSPYLHFGHVSAHQVFAEVMAAEGWSPGKLAKDAKGKSSGWWGVSEPAESLLDQLITWRELGYNFCWQRDDYDRYSSLPDWARQTLAEHAGDPRPELYTLDELEQAATADPVWNATQRQLADEGRIHSYLRMLWGKKIFEWSPSPQEALAAMIELNNKYALDGRNPNSYSGIFWVLGRYDRAWGPERPIYGKIRYMTSASTQRKLNLANYLQKFGPAEQ